MRNQLGIVSGLLLASAGLPAQEIPIHVYPPMISDTVAKAAGAADAARILNAYLKRRFEALGIPLTQSDTVYALEMHFTVLPLTQGGYDVTAAYTICNCSAAVRNRSVPFDWHQLHAYADLEEVARYVAEGAYSELKALEKLRETLRQRRPADKP